ncbi:MAG TPA: hypothetical protein VJU78_14310 [Chitinophagaceae bacterium]|nr:hypothetical protein [Chitinophagaceae bacterium]
MIPDNKSPHILNTSANLLGFCLIIITSIKVSRFSSATIIDNVTGVAAICLMLSCMLSYLSMKVKSRPKAERLESVADMVFLSALLCLSATIILVSFNLFR